MLTAGSKAPDLAVVDHDGNPFSSADVGPQRALLWWYPKADTPG